MITFNLRFFYTLNSLSTCIIIQRSKALQICILKIHIFLLNIWILWIPLRKMNYLILIFFRSITPFLKMCIWLWSITTTAKKWISLPWSWYASRNWSIAAIRFLSMLSHIDLKYFITCNPWSSIHISIAIFVSFCSFYLLINFSHRKHSFTWSNARNLSFTWRLLFLITKNSIIPFGFISIVILFNFIPGIRTSKNFSFYHFFTSRIL